MRLRKAAARFLRLLLLWDFYFLFFSCFFLIGWSVVNWGCHQGLGLELGDGPVNVDLR